MDIRRWIHQVCLRISADSDSYPSPDPRNSCSNLSRTSYSELLPSPNSNQSSPWGLSNRRSHRPIRSTCQVSFPPHSAQLATSPPLPHHLASQRPSEQGADRSVLLLGPVKAKGKAMDGAEEWWNGVEGNGHPKSFLKAAHLPKIKTVPNLAFHPKSPNTNGGALARGADG